MAYFYHRDQAGSPTLTYSTAAANVNHFTSFKAVLKACLVNGYGDQPAAGWSLVNEGSNFIVLRNGAHTGYVCFTWVAALMTVSVAETYLGMSGDYMQGDGLKSGTASGANIGTGPSQKVYTGNWFYSSALVSWGMFADERTFVLSLPAPHVSNPTDLSNDVALTYPVTLYAGEDSGGHFICVGGMNSTSVNGNATVKGTFGATGFTSLRDPATGMLVDTGALAVDMLATDVMRQSLTSSAPLQRLELSRMDWVGGGVHAGYLRGIAVPWQLACHYPAPLAAALGATGEGGTRNACVPVPLGDSFNYLVSVKYQLSLGFLLTDNPEFW